MPLSSGTLSRAERRRRRAPLIPEELRQEAVAHARSLAKKYRALFIADRQLKDRVLRLERTLLPPRPRPRGRPRNPITSRALALYRRFRRKHPEEIPRQLWARVYPLAIPDWETKSETETRDARAELRERILWRRRKRRVRTIPAEISAS